MLQAIVLVLLLAVGVILASTIAWVFIAIPMMIIVLLFLRDLEASRARLSEDEDDAELAATWDPSAASDSPIIVMRRGTPQTREEEVLAGRGHS